MRKGGTLRGMKTGLHQQWLAVCSLALVGCAAAPQPTVAAVNPVVVAEKEPAPVKRFNLPAVELPKVALSNDAGCDEARQAYVESWRIAEANGRPDLTAGQFGAVLGRGSYFDRCDVPPAMQVSICTAVQHGQAVGVTVATLPKAPRVARCIAKGVRALQFPAHPRMDVTRTVFAGS